MQLHHVLHRSAFPEELENLRGRAGEPLPGPPSRGRGRAPPPPGRPGPASGGQPTDWTVGPERTNAVPLFRLRRTVMFIYLQLSPCLSLSKLP
jgi:hypothetical protein